MEKVDLIVKDAMIVNSGGRYKASILVKNEKIVGIVDSPVLPEARQVIDARGRFVIPGVIDPHTHIGGKYLLEQDYRTETPGSAAGGVTTVGIMHGAGRASRTFKEFVTEEDTVPWSQCFPIAKDIADSSSMVDYFYTPYMNTRAQVDEIPRLAEDFGITSIKFYANLKSHEMANVGPFWKRRMGVPVPFGDDLIYLGFKLMGEAVGQNGIVLLHHENTEVSTLEMERLLAQGRTDAAAWTDRTPPWAEAEHVTRYGRFAQETNTRQYVLHLSTRHGLEACIRARQDGVNIWVETCPQYLLKTKHDRDGVLLKVNPPIRDKEHNEALWQGVIKRHIDNLGTDHVVSSLHEKTVKGDVSVPGRDPKNNVWHTGSGFVGMDFFLPIMLSEGVVKGRITLEHLVEMACENNAKCFGLFPRKGAIQVGSDADLVILDMEKTQTITPALLHSYCDFTIWEGWEVTGWPATTVLRGKVIFDGGEVKGEHGYGRYLPRDSKAPIVPTLRQLVAV